MLVLLLLLLPVPGLDLQMMTRTATMGEAWGLTARLMPPRAASAQRTAVALQQQPLLPKGPPFRAPGGARS